MAKRAGISRYSLTQFDSGHRTSDSLCQKMQHDIEKEGIRFVEE